MKQSQVGAHRPSWKRLIPSCIQQVRNNHDEFPIKWCYNTIRLCHQKISTPNITTSKTGAQIFPLIPSKPHQYQHTKKPPLEKDPTGSDNNRSETMRNRDRMVFVFTVGNIPTFPTSNSSETISDVNCWYVSWIIE